ncbi:oligosaccharide flippase family protein [Micromonospora sp. NPDC049374]|uniref:oligosaccharide flippase family protein n=1 Tax=Micromonospora sp. NPDC049374 TaxID=3154352 RepID=UPI0034377875
MVAVSQMLFVAWLSPAQFGVWATATASMAVLTGLVNFGEVNGYLAGGARSLGEVRRSIWRLNAILTAGAFAVVGGYWYSGRHDLAVLVALIGLNLPLLGECNLLYAAYVRRTENGRLVRAQAISAAARTALGLAVAWLTESAIAFAAAMLLYSVAMIILLSPGTRQWPERAGDRLTAVGWRVRGAWSAQALSQLLPTQVDFLVVSVVAGPSLLGVYFFAYQVTVGLSAMVAGPLVKSVLSTLAAQDEQARPALAERLMSTVAALAGGVAAVGVGVITVAGGALPSQWEGAAATIGLLLASVPARFLSVISDAAQMAAGAWWRSSGLNALDAVGTAAVALTAVAGDITVLAIAVVGWKVAFMCVRVWRSPLGLPAWQRVVVAAPTVLVALSLVTAVLAGPPYLWFLTISVLVVSGGRLFTLWRVRRPVAVPAGAVAAESSWS